MNKYTPINIDDTLFVFQQCVYHYLNKFLRTIESITVKLKDVNNICGLTLKCYVIGVIYNE